MTTIPSRECIFDTALNSLLGQSYWFDKLIINIDDEELFVKYQKYIDVDYRIELNLCEKKWKSCNKLLPTLKKYPNAVIITVDDDIIYPIDCIKKLVEKHEKFPNYIISHENFPLLVDKETKEIKYFLGFDAKLEQSQFGKYMSNCCLYPPHTFDGTDLFNYDDFMYVTLGYDDEMWFWINSVLKGVKSITLNYVFTFFTDGIENDSEKLSDYNIKRQDIYDLQIKRLNEKYGEKIYQVVINDLPEFFINNDNAYLHAACSSYMKLFYTYGYKITLSNDVTSEYKKRLKEIYNF